MTKIATVNYHDPIKGNWNKEYKIEYKETPLIWAEVQQPCGNGVYIYNKKTNQLGRWSLSFSHDLPYHSNEDWNSKKEWHLVVASSDPLWVWWYFTDAKTLKFGDIGCALPQIKI